MKGGRETAPSARAAEPAGSDILTDRTRMRRHTVADFEQSAALWSDPDVVRYISGKRSTRAESWSRLLRYIGHWQALSFGYWVVEDRMTGQFLGEVGLADYKRDMTPSIENGPKSVGFWRRMRKGAVWRPRLLRQHLPGATAC